MTESDWKYLEMAGNGWKWLEWMKIAGMAGNGWNCRNGWKWP